MTSQEFKDLVRKEERFERFSGYFFLLIPLVIPLCGLGVELVAFIKNPEITFGLQVVVVFWSLILLPCLWLAWWGIRRVNRKYESCILIQFDERQISESELMKRIADKLNYRKRKKKSELLILDSKGWEIGHIIYWGSGTNELYADLRLEDSLGFIGWGEKKLKERFMKEINAIAQAGRYTISVKVVTE